jgi:hypothetical protein
MPVASSPLSWPPLPTLVAELWAPGPGRPHSDQSAASGQCHEALGTTTHEPVSMAVSVETSPARPLGLCPQKSQGRGDGWREASQGERQGQ